MTRWLYNHIPSFRKAVNQILHTKQSVNPEMEFSFIDSNGKQYFRYKDDMLMPMLRKGVVNEFYTKMTTCLTEKELGQYLSVMKGAHQELLNAGKLISKPFSLIGYLITELEERKALQIHPELCFDLCAVIYVREDERESDKYNWNIHEEKVAQFKRDSASGLYDFFFMSGWQEYLPYSHSSPSALKTYVNSIKPTLAAQKRMLGNLMEQYGLSSQENTS